MISEKLLKESGALEKVYPKGSTLFSNGGQATHYYQIRKGNFKLYTQLEGKEFIDGFFSTGESIGDSNLFTSEPYYYTAIASLNSVVLSLPKDNFLTLLSGNPSQSIAYITNLSKRSEIHSKLIAAVTCLPAEQRIISLFKILGCEYSKSEKMVNNNYELIPFKRKDIANMLGLRVETVIRAIRSLSDNNQVKVENRKIYFPCN
jgi:CRP-like cAMP-binding protein